MIRVAVSSISRARITFCALPPESEPAGWLGDEKRTSHAFSDASQAFRSRDGLISLSTPPRSRTRAAQFSQSGLDRLSPSLFRSNGITRSPDARRSLSGRRVTSTPSSTMSPPVRSARCEMARTSVRWPLPSTPGNADDLAAGDAERDVVEGRPLGIDPGRDPAQFEDRRGLRGRCRRRAGLAALFRRADQRLAVGAGERQLQRRADDRRGEVRGAGVGRRRPGLRSGGRRGAPSPSRRSTAPRGSCGG